MVCFNVLYVASRWECDNVVCGESVLLVVRACGALRVLYNTTFSSNLSPTLYYVP